ncbi:MAG: T9SS type A sorting domain-containing protein, partial [Ignavibacteria bacterium]|nr:T9SS type A sorting domain-containing protein [Ignavibacteria bacterium]
EPADGGLGDLRIVSLVVGTNGTIFGGTDGDGVYTYGLTTGVGTSHDIPDRFLLLQNYPNPFNGSSTFELALTKSSDVSLIIYDQLGRKVATVIDDRLTPGIYSRRWDASGYSSGVYFYRLQSGNLTVTKKMLLLR